MKIYKGLLVRSTTTIFICLYGVIVSLYIAKAQNITLGITLPFGLGVDSSTISGEYYAQAAYLAVEAVNADSTLLAGKTLKLVVNTTDCTSKKTLEAFTSQWKTKDVQGFIGTGCGSCQTTAELAGVFNIALMSQICTDTILSDKSKYPTFARTIPANDKLAVPVLQLLLHYNWTLTGLVVQDSEDWIERGDDIKNVLNSNGITVTIMRKTPSMLNYKNTSSRTHFEKIIQDVQETSRVIILAMEYSFAREALYYAGKLRGSQNSNFAFIMFALDSSTIWNNTATPTKWLEGKFPGESENVTESLKQAFQSALLIAMNPLRTSTYETFVNNIKTNTSNPLVSSNVYQGAGSSIDPPLLGAYLYDAVMQLAVAFNRTLTASNSLDDGKMVMSTIEGRSYQSILGYERYIDSKGDAGFDLVLMDYDSTSSPGNFTEIGKYERSGAGSDVLKISSSAKWPGDQGPPKDKPKCGFYGENCRKNKNITIGLLLPFQYAYDHSDIFSAGKYSASGITVALEKINSDLTYLPDYHINLIWSETECNEETSIRMMATFVERRVDAFIGFACKCSTQARIAASLNIPVISHMCTSDDVSNKELYPTFARTIPADGAIGPSIVAMLDYFKWGLVGIFSEEGKSWAKRGQFIYDYLQQRGKKISIHEKAPPELVYSPEKHADRLKKSLKKITKYARVIILAMKYSLAREVIYFAGQLGLYTGDYAFILFELSVNEVDLKIKDPTKWLNGVHRATNIKTDNFKNMFKSVLVMAVNVPGSVGYEKFNYQLKIKASQAPFYSKVYQGNITLPWGEKRNLFDTPAPIYGAYIYDATNAYVLAINRTLAAGKNYKDGKEVLKMLFGRKYHSIVGTDIYMNKEGDIEYNMTLLDYRSNDTQMVDVGMFHITEGINTSQVFQLHPNKTMAWYGGNNAPRDVPACGFNGEFCIDNKFRLSTIEIVCIGLASLVVLLLLVGAIIYRKQKIERELASELWRIDYKDVVIRSKRQAGSFRSQISILSNESFDNINQRQLFTTVGMLMSHTVAIKKINKSGIELSREVRLELNLIRNVRHENLTPFMGACVDPPNICIIELYCPKGSLQDILENEDVKLDSMFISSLMNDIVKGMIFLHSTEIKSHGRLKSSNCVVDGRWVLKITDYGLTKFKANQVEREDCGEYASFYQKLWTAPELLRMKNPPPQGTQKGDVYSFSVILQEMLTRSGPFDLSYYHTEPKEIIQRVHQKEHPPYRPKLSNVLDSVNLPGMRELAEKCWNENVDARPDFEEVRKQVRKHSMGKTTNIMDNMVNMLEKYANNLESLVEERTEQLADEKRKTDNLLHRMLPPTVARDLVQGKPIKAENFDHVSIFFSDIVGFTSLSSESTPFQIVDLLNDLYTLFDDIINNYDVYKVETIGDAYMVVSGLPISNGDRHAGEIASMSLHMLRDIRTFTVRHQPDYKLKLRIGIHSGSVCAGVVGIKMPRYCLFGDTVNTASRMESNGEALKIHISPATKQVLDGLGGYHIEERGEVFLKGKGTWITYWLSGSSIPPRKGGKPTVVKETKPKDESVKVQRRN
ncbi:hypothetical protein QZH41_014003, partial [Actinostola sp. cb2023]